MLTTQDIMEGCWEEDGTYEEVVAECQKYNLPIPSSEEYDLLCKFNNDSIQEWKNSLDDPYDDRFDRGETDIFIDTSDDGFLGDDR